MADEFRKLASIQIINDLKPIEGKDRILQATILGWSLIVGKDDFKVGDKCVYIEVDSVLDPNNPVFEQARKRSNRIKTIKMAGIYSQGIAYPLSAFNMNPDRYNVGDDVTDILKIKKYDPQAEEEEKLNISTKPVKKYPQFLMRFAWFRKLVLPSKRQQKGFPTQISKTDEVRCLDGKTDILTNKGKILISDIVNKKLDVKVASLNEKNEIEWSNIIDYQKFKADKELIKIVFPYRPLSGRKNTLICTKDHKLLTKNGYKRADELTINDQLSYIVEAYQDNVIPFIYGMLLGDGCISPEKRLPKFGNKSKNMRLSYCQGEKQYEYFKFKQKILGVNNVTESIGKSGFADTKIYRGGIKSDFHIMKTLYEDKCIDENNKLNITQNFCDRLSPLSLAIWYLDDGTCKHLQNEVYNYSNKINKLPSVEISTNSFSQEEVELLSNTLKNKFNIDNTIRIDKKKDGRCYPYIFIPVKSTPIFMKLISPYVPECMRYKLIDEERNTKCIIENLEYLKQNRIIYENPISIEKFSLSKFANKRMVYDLEIEKNHNFIAEGIVNHNCQVIPDVLKCKDKCIITEKIDGCLTGDTMITTSEGQKTMSYLFNHQEEHPYVLSYNEDKGICEFKKVLEFHKIKKIRDIYKIGVGFRGKGNRPKFIHCTDNHKFLTNDGWKRADELQMTDKLRHYCRKINNELIEVILGCLIGDASINSNYRENSDYRTIHFVQGIKQSDYFDYKKQLFGDYFIDGGTKISGYGSTIRFGTLKSNLALNKLIHNVCTVNGKKVITEKWMDMMTPISLAFWYMDDGSIQNRENNRLGERIRIATQGYSYEENLLFQKMLKEKFNIDSTIGDKATYKGYTIILDVENTDKFCNLIAPYICDSMKYKLPKKYENRECYFKNVTFDGTEGIVETDILSIEKEEIKDNYVFDLTVEDNENYFANNVLVHNCSLSALLIKTKTWFGKTKYEFILCSRNLRLWTPDGSYYWEMAKKYSLEEKLREMIGDNEWVAIQGEVYGPSIQKNPYKLNSRELRIFNLIYPSGRLGSVEAEEICKKHELMFVPILDENFVLPDTVEEMLKYATAKSVINPNVMREGVVVRSKDGKRSFKAVSPEYLLKYEE